MRISDLDTRSAALGESTAYFAVDQASSNVTHKIDYNALARAIIEQYTGSTIGGAAQSVKAALDNTSIVNVLYTDSQTSELGGVDEAMKDLITSKKVPANRTFVGMFQALNRYTMVGYIYPNYDFGCILFFNFAKTMKLLTLSSNVITISVLPSRSEMDATYAIGYNGMTNIPNETDLNTYTSPGNYVSKSSSNTATLTNTPVTGSGFSLHVESTAGANGQYIMQTLIRQTNVLPEIYCRAYNSSSWSAWHKLAYEDYATETLSGVNVVMYRYGHNALLRIDATFNQSSSYVEVGKFTNMSTFNNFYFSYVNPGNGNKAKLKYASDGTLSIMCPDGNTAIDASFPLLLS